MEVKKIRFIIRKWRVVQAMWNLPAWLPDDDEIQDEYIHLNPHRWMSSWEYPHPNLAALTYVFSLRMQRDSGIPVLEWPRFEEPAIWPQCGSTAVIRFIISAFQCPLHTLQRHVLHSFLVLG